MKLENTFPNHVEDHYTPFLCNEVFCKRSSPAPYSARLIAPPTRVFRQDSIFSFPPSGVIETVDGEVFPSFSFFASEPSTLCIFPSPLAFFAALSFPSPFFFFLPPPSWIQACSMLACRSSSSTILPPRWTSGTAIFPAFPCVCVQLNLRPPLTPQGVVKFFRLSSFSVPSNVIAEVCLAVIGELVSPPFPFLMPFLSVSRCSEVARCLTRF